jgi:hypothetical protein
MWNSADLTRLEVVLAVPRRRSRIAQMTGSEQTRLIVLRGNSGAGKTSVAMALREACGRGVAWVGQDLIRRTILREKDCPGAPNIGLMDQVARYSLDHGYHVILDGIMYADRYGEMLAGLKRDHRGRSCFYYLDVSIDETLRRHATRPQASEFGPTCATGTGRETCSPPSPSALSRRPAPCRRPRASSWPRRASGRYHGEDGVAPGHPQEPGQPGR